MKNLFTKFRSILWPWSPESNREAGDAVVKNIALHWFPAKVSLKSISWDHNIFVIYFTCAWWRCSDVLVCTVS